MPPLFETCRQHLQQHLSVERNSHCLGVWRMMERVAPIYGIDPEAARWSGLMHDVAKELPDTELLRLLRRFHPASLDSIPEKCRVNTYLHGPAGAVLMHKLWEFPNTDIVLAIEQHCGCYLDMPLLSRCLEVVDLASPMCEYPGRAKLERELLAGHLDRAELLHNVWSVEYLLARGVSIHPTYQEKIRRLSAIVKPAPDFLARGS